MRLSIAVVALVLGSRWRDALRGRRGHKGRPDHPVQRVHRAPT